MSLAAGTRLGPYEIISAIGAGGMGDVYKAKDTRLDRTVAIKIVRTDFSERFEREAKAISALNHPNICTLHDVGRFRAEGAPAGQDEDVSFLVMEFVDGAPIAGPLPLADVLRYGVQICEALEAAHRKSIVHRDLKPANILATRSGIKLLDFGLAKLQPGRTSAPGNEATMAALTGAHTIVGTPQYMAPEQIEGREADARSDIFALGCVLYELITGTRAFQGNTASNVMAAILATEPRRIGELAPVTPPALDWVVMRCLAKDPEARWQSARDVALQLKWIADQPAVAADAEPAARPRRALLTGLAIGIAITAAVAAIGLYVTRGRSQQTATAELPSLQAAVVLPRDLRLAVGEDPSARFAISPDGRRLAVVASDPGGDKIWVRPLDGVTAQAVAGTEGASYPFWSPDSRSIGFVARPGGDVVAGGSPRLMRVDLSSGQVTTLAETTLAAIGAWNRDGVILFTAARNGPIHRVGTSGGVSAPVTTLDRDAGEVQHVHPSFLPDGRHFLYTAIGSKTGGATDPRGVYVGSIDPAEKPALLFEGGTNAKFADGHIIFVRNGRLMAQPFDLAGRRFEPGATPRLLAEGVQELGGAGAANAGAFSVSDTGVIAYQAVAPVTMQLEWWSRGGQRISALGGQADYADVVLSPDGQRAAVSQLNPVEGTRDLWVFDVKRTVSERVTTNPGDDIAPVWSPTGDRLVYSSGRQGRSDLFQKPSTSADGETLVPVTGLDVGKFAADWSRDDVLIFIAGGRIIARSDLWLLPLAGERRPIAFAESPAVETHARFSPDGKWVVYTSIDSGRFEVYVRPAIGDGPRERVSVNGGRYGLWRRDFSEVFFLSPDNKIMSAAVRVQNGRIQVGAIQPLFQINFRRVRLDGYPYAVSPDGQRFLVNTLIEDAAPPAISLIVNWRQALRR